MADAGTARMRPAAAVMLLAMALPVHAREAPTAPEVPIDYATAKDAADADEASLDAGARQRLHDAQAAFVQSATAACATNEDRPDLSRFAVVMDLDADGQVTRTWREGTSPLSACIETQARSATLAAPPRQPFRAVVEISFTP